MYIRCFTIFLMICCSLPATVFAQFTGTAPYCHERGGLILNEISNMGASGQDEYFELIVMPDPNNPTANINISGWIIDDNNYPGSGVGTATGYLAFGDCYTSVPPGSILVVYDSTNPNAALPADDPTDSNSDNVYIIPDNSTCMFKCSSNPNTSSSEYCPCTGGLNPGGSWVLGMRNQGDLAQVRNPDEVFIHGIHWGDVGLGDLVVADPNLIYFSGNSGGKVFMFNDGDYGDDANWTESNLTTDQTPGAYNNATNQGFITNILADPAAYCQGDIAYPCKADAGDLTPPTGETNGFTICQGQDKPAFGHNYAAPDEDDPGAGYSYIYVLSKNTAPYLILGLSTTGDFDLSTLPFGTYYIWGLSVKNSDLTANGYANITDYADGFANVNTLLADEVECGFCSDLDNKDDAGNIMSFNVISPILASSAPNSICLGESATIILTLEDGATVTWSPGGETDTSITITPTTTTTYTATVVSLTCPTVTMNFTVAVENCSGEYCPDFDISGSTATNTTYCMPAGGNVNLCFAGTDLPPGGEIKWFYSDTLLADPTQGNLITTLDIPESVTTSGDVFWDFGTGAGTSGSGGPAGTSSDITKATGNTAVRNNPGTYWGVTPNGTCGDGVSEQYLNANTWNNTTLAQAIAAGRYYEVCVTADAACDLRITNISLSYGSSTTGPTSMSVLTSDDGFTNPIGSSIGFATLTCHSISFPVPNHLVQSGQQYCVRVYAYNTSNITGTFRIDDVDLDWNSVCPPNYDGDFGCTTFTLPTDDTMCGKSYYFTAAVSPFSDNCLGGSPEPDPYTDPIQINISCPQVQGVITNILCNGQGNGSIDLTVTGGVGPYNFTWAGPEPIGNIEDPTNLIAGTYNVTVTETASGAGCTTTGTYTITQPAALTASLVSTAVDTCGLGNGAIIVTATGGTEEYSFSIDNIAYQPSPEFYNLNAGTYTIWVDDANGCGPIQVSGINITATPVPDLSLSGAAPEICNGNAFDLTTLNIADANSTSGTISWHSGTPANAGNQLASTTVSPTSTTTYYALKTTTPYGCTDELAVTLTVHPNPTANITPDPAEICQGGTINFNGNPSGGSGIYNTHVWTGSGTVFLSATNIVNPVFTATASGSFTLTYTVTDSEGCTASDNITVTVNATMNPNLITPPVLCEDDAVLDLNLYDDNALPGVWSGTGVTGTTFNPAGLGGQTITLTYDPADPCANNGNINVTINALQVPILLAPAALCANSPVLDLSLYDDDNFVGTWSGVGVFGNSFDPSIAGTGNHVISFTPSGSCVAAATINIVVNPTTTPVLGTPPILCDDDALLDLNLYDDDLFTGVWSGTGVSGTNFDPSGLGGQTITLIFDPDGDCSLSASIDIEVKNSWTPNVGQPGPYCEGDPIIDLNTFELPGYDGTWTGLGVVGADQFDPSLAGVGNHALTFTGNTPPPDVCPKTVTINVVVNPSSQPVLGTPAPVCATDAPIDLTVFEDAAFTGAWSGIGVSGTNFDPSGLGGQTITLTFDPDGDCGLSENISISVMTPAIPNLTQPNPLCVSDNPLDLNNYDDNSLPGTWSGIGVTGTNFDPSVSGAGTFTITYTPSGACTQVATLDIVVNPDNIPVLTTPPPICATDPAFSLIPYQDINYTGTWSGLGVMGGNTFSPSAVIPGNYVLTFSAIGACVADATIMVTVIPAATPVLTSFGPLCDNDAVVDLTLYDDDAFTGTWSGLGVAANIFDPSVAGAGNITLTFTPSGGCGAPASIDVVINAAPVLSLTTPAALCAGALAFDLTPFASPTGGSWAGPGVAGTAFDPANGNIGANWLVYSLSQNGCTTTDSIKVVVNPNSDPILTTPPALCASSGLIDLSPYEDPNFAGQWLGSGVVLGSQFDPAGFAGQTVTITFDPDGNCGNTADVNITVYPYVSINLVYGIQTISALNCNAPFDLNIWLSDANGNPLANPVWSGGGFVDALGLFTPSGLSPGNYTATCLVTDPISGCSASMDLYIQINEVLPLLVTGTTICANDPAFDLYSLVLPGSANGEWSGLGVSNGIFDPASVSGQTSVTLTYSAICNDASLIDISMGCPADYVPVCGCDGVDYSNACIAYYYGGVTAYIPGPCGLYPSNTIGNCGQNPENITIIIEPLLSAATQAPAITKLCNNGNNPNQIDLDDLVVGDMGGMWSVSPDGTIDAGNIFNATGLSTGIYTFTYVVTGSCNTDQTTQTIEIIDCDINCTESAAINPPTPICALAGNTLDLNTLITGTPGGTWAILPAVPINAGSIIDVSALNGNYAITYTVTGAPGCPDVSETETLTVQLPPVADINPPTDPLCQGDVLDLDDLLAAGTGTNGVWNTTAPAGTIGAGNIFNSSGLAEGSYTITYGLSGLGVCPDDLSSQTIMVVVPTANAGIDLDVCGLSTTLNALGDAGTWTVVATPSGTATANFSFPNALITNVTVTEPGVYTFNYAGTKNNCTANDQVNINFVAPLNVQYTTICAADETTYDLEITVSGGVPPYNLVGATFIGTNPYVANFASNTPFNIAIDDANAVCPEIIISGNKDCSCQPTATDPIVVNPNLTWCENEAIPSFTIANLGDTYYWLANINDDISLAIATGNSFTPPGIGTYWVVAQSSGGCLSNVVEITANELPVGTMTVKSPYVVCEGDVIGVLVLPTTFDGSISWTSADGLDNGSSKAGFLPVRSLPGIYQYFLTETYTDGTCTSAPTPVELIINAKGKPNLPPLPNLCDDASVVDLTDFNDPNYEAGTWTGNGVGNNLFDPKTAGLGIFDLIFTPAGACSEADTAQIEVIDCSACFTVTQKAQGATTICSGQPADLPFFEASVIISDPSNFTGLTWFEDPALTKPVSAAFWQFTAPDNCILQQKTLYLGAACALLSQPILAGDITVVINPPFDSNLLTLNTPADCEIPTISTNCSIYKITPISVPIVINPGDNGNATWSVTLNTTAGCWTEFVDIPYNCPNICPQANLVQTAPALSCDGDIINLEIAITPANALLNTDYSVQWYENGNPIAGATNLTYSTTAQAQTCNEITNAYSVVIKCLKTTDPDITLDAGQVIIPPKFDQANLTITNGLCGTLPNITSGCSTYTITPINVPTIINPGETGQAEYQISGNCFLETVFVDYACPDVLCPTVTTTLSGSIKFCDGNAPADFSNFEGQIIINDPDAQANGFEWFKDVNLTQTVNPDDFVYNGNGCSLPIDTAYIALLCKDGSKIKAGWLSVVVYVAPVNIVQPNPCVLVVASACPPGSVVVEYLQSNGTWAAAPEAGTITANWRAYLPFAPDNDNDGQPDCITTGTSTIPENNLTVNAGPNQTICQGQLAALVATISGGQNPNSGTWTTNDGGSFDDANAALTNFNPDAGAGVYTLVFTVSDECYTASDEVVITVLGNTLTVNAGPDQTICQGEPINLSATITTSGGNATGQWTASVAGLFDDANNVNAIFTPTNLDATEVWCYFTANDVCGLATDSVLITILPNVFVDAGLDKIIFLGQTAQLEATGATAYLWETDPSLSCLNCANPIASPTQTTTYIVATPDACGNSDTVTVVVNEKPIAEIQIPSAFSPNNDNINDVFKPFIGNAPFTNYIFAVYDRWGNQLFETTDPADGWNGTYKFKDLEVGVYVFYATIWFEDEPQARKLQGNVTLVR